MKNQSGALLLEAILALGITIFIVTGIVTALVASINNSSFSKNQNVAASISQEGLEIARNMKDADFEKFKALPGEVKYCPVDGNLIVQLDCKQGVFTKYVFISHGTLKTGGSDEDGTQRCEAGSSFVSSVVEWSDSKCKANQNCHKIELSSCFADLYKVTGP